MNLIKSLDFFDPNKVNERIHIIGCGSVGSTVAELLARFGLTKISLYDFDKVEEKNIVNQMFNENDVGKSKVKCVANLIWRINNSAANDIEIHEEGWTPGMNLDGYVFLCVDDIDIRKNIVDENRTNKNIKAMFDFRTRLTDAQHYACDWSEEKNIECFRRTMNFSKEEAIESTPVSACGVTLGVAPTVRMICNAGVVNLINFIKSKKIKKMILVDAFNFSVDAI